MSVKDKNNQLVSEIFELHKQQMYYTAYSILQNVYDAEDAVQNSLISIIKHVNQLDEDASSCRTHSYLMKTVKHTALNMRRDKKYAVPIDQLNDSIRSYENINQEYCKDEFMNFMIKAINELGDTYRDILSLYLVNHLSVIEISEITGLSGNTIRTKIRRGKESLKKSANSYLKGEKL